MSKLFIFDLGGVILFNDDTISKIAKHYSLNLLALNDDYHRYSKPLLEGFMSTDDYYRHMEIEFKLPPIEEDLFSVFFTPTVNTFMLEQISRIRANGHRCVVGSNTFKPHWDYINKKLPSVVNSFDSLYASHEIHISKPDKNFWEYILDKEGYEAKDTVFIDDRKENTDSATALGIESYQYQKDDYLISLFFSRCS